MSKRRKLNDGSSDEVVPQGNIIIIYIYNNIYNNNVVVINYGNINTTACAVDIIQEDVTTTKGHPKNIQEKINIKKITCSEKEITNNINIIEPHTKDFVVATSDPCWSTWSISSRDAGTSRGR